MAPSSNPVIAVTSPSPRPTWRNHYTPQFYLRQLASGPDGKIWCCQRQPSGQISEKRCSPKETAFLPNLYTEQAIVPFMQPDKPDVIESEFFKKIDDKAAPVLQKLIEGAIGSLTEHEREVWALFLNSLLERMPPMLERINEGARESAARALDSLRAAHTTVESLASLEELVRRMDIDALVINSVLGRMVHEIVDKKVVDYFKSCRWRIVSLGDGLDLLTTDAPLIVNCNAGPAPIRMLTMALNPKRFFIMYPPSWEADVNDEFVRALLLAHNFLLMYGPAQYVYSQNRLADGPIVRNKRLVEYCLGRPETLGAANDSTP